MVVRVGGYNLAHSSSVLTYKVVSELAATATATAVSSRHHALRNRPFLATPLATVIAVAVAGNSDTPLMFHKIVSPEVLTSTSHSDMAGNGLWVTTVS